MFNQVPIPVWLLMAIVATAFVPARYVYRYVANAPSRRDITLPPVDLSWRTSGLLARNLAILGVLAPLAVFIFTPAARQFAHSPSFWPILMAALGTWAIGTVARGFWIGQIKPFARGFYNTYARQTQPKRFWTSMVWNTLLGCLLLWLPFQMKDQAIEERCYDAKNAFLPKEEISSCDQLIRKRGGRGKDLANLVAARGSAHYRLGDYRHALIDYTNAVRLDPNGSSAYYNLGLVDEQLDNKRGAVDDYTAAIRVGKDNGDAYFQRGLIFLDSGKLDEAVTDFTTAMKLKPDDIFPVANRGIAYAWKRNEVRAEQDFTAVRLRDPSNAVVLRGEAILSMNAGDMQAVVKNLTAALKSEPDNRFSLRMRADAYERLGKQEMSDADRDELWRLSKKTKKAGG